jgi:hypothetical protein
MESTKTSRGFLVAILVVVVVGLTALDIYQDHVIAHQRYELNWLKTHSIISLDAIAADVRAAQNAKGAANGQAPKTPPPSVAAVPQSTKPAASAPTAKP